LPIEAANMQIHQNEVTRMGRQLRMLVLVASVAACSASDREARPEGDLPVSHATRAAVVALGSQAAEKLAATLVSRLQAEVTERGPAGAVGFCSIEGLPLTANVSRETGFAIKRTSSRVRNPANTPDSLERVALDEFEAAAGSGDALPEDLVQRTPDGDYRYYRPLRVQPFCLQCHGRQTELGEGVAGVLAEQYPDDEATGYRTGDFRGLIRVSVPSSALE
jgi:hypothetical protein